ncbi:MAG: response regulator transcription factor [Acidiferrobacterales bacterium]|nr:response regulator transcription factor [Acidiferrobacterales bacterium]
MTEPTVFVVDDDEAVRGGLEQLIQTIGLNVQTHASADEFLASYRHGQPGCLVLDIRMPGMGGLDLQEQLARQGIQLPIIFLTGHGDVPAAVRALKAGAMDFLEKPFNSQVLLDLIQQAIRRDAETHTRVAEESEVARRLTALTGREHQVLEKIIDGKANKVIAMELGISERTVEFHRSKIMKKMQVRSLAELVNLVHRPALNGDR